jgi:hypothetical protein
LKETDTDIAFQYWLKNARPGERVLYYYGFLMRDREVFMRGGGFSDNFPPSIKTAIAAWKAYMNGSVHLIQKKQGMGVYEYIAVKAA